jgi:hypothetical protein
MPFCRRGRSSVTSLFLRHISKDASKLTTSPIIPSCTVSMKFPKAFVVPILFFLSSGTEAITVTLTQLGGGVAEASYSVNPDGSCIETSKSPLFLCLPLSETIANSPFPQSIFTEARFKISTALLTEQNGLPVTHAHFESKSGIFLHNHRHRHTQSALNSHTRSLRPRSTAIL